MTTSVCGFVCPPRAHSYKSRFKHSRLLVTQPHSRFPRPWKWNDGGRPQGRGSFHQTHAAGHAISAHTCDSTDACQCRQTHRHSQMRSPLSLLKTEYLLTFPSQSFSFMGRILESLQ